MPTLGQCFSYHVHGTALKLALIVVAAIHDREGAGEELGRYAQYCRHPHPKNRARPTDLDGQRDPGNVAHANGACHARGQRTEMRDVSGIIGVVVFASDQIKAVAKVEKGCEL